MKETSAEDKEEKLQQSKVPLGEVHELSTLGDLGLNCFQQHR